MHVTLTRDEIISALKHYRSLAKQDILLAGDAPDKQALKDHAEARRRVYAELISTTEAAGPEQALAQAKAAYRELRERARAGEDKDAELRALENFFLLVGVSASSVA
jgi:DNA-binding GntR family transcriptional regulator